MSLEEQIQAYKELSLYITALESQKKELSNVILEQMSEKTLSIAGYIVRRYDRLSIKTSLEEARQLDATKMEEVLDRDKLKKLHQSGQVIPGVAPAPFIQVSLQKQGSTATDSKVD